MPSYPRGAHRLSGGRNYRRVVATLQNDATGAGSGSSGSAPALTYAQTVAVDTPVGYWKMNEVSGTLTDSSGQGMTLTGSGSPTYGGTGPGTGQKCISFVSASSQQFKRVGAGGTTPLQVGDVFTLEVWYKRSAVQSSFQGLMTCGANTYSYRVQNTNEIHLDKNAAAGIGSSTSTITDTTTWHHCVCTKNGATTKFYIDGVDVTGTITNATMAVNTNDFFLASSGDTNYLNGSLSHCAVYATALSAARVSAHFAAMV